MNPDGTARALVTRNAGRPAWSPDGRRIAFVSDRHTQDDIYVVRSNGSGLRRLTVAVRFCAAGGDPCTIAGTPGNDHLRGTRVMTSSAASAATT
jgi:WD40-like Beta Propeller Repeat